MTWTLIGTGIALLFTAWYYFVRPLSYWKNKKVRQSKPLIFLGDTWRHIFYKNEYATKYLQWMYDNTKGGRYFGFYEFSKPLLCITDPELIKHIGVKDFDHFQDHNLISIEPKVDYFWGSSVLSLRGEKWKHMRTTLSPSFTSKKMKILFDLIADVADNVVSFVSAQNEDVVELEMKDALSRYTNDVIATTSFGISTDSLRDKTNSFFMSGKKLTSPGVFRTLEFILLNAAPAFICQLFGLKIVKDDVAKIFAGAIKDAIKTREKNNIVRPDMIQLLLESRKTKSNKDGILIDQASLDNGMSDDEIAAQALIFFFAGFDTVSQALSFAAYELATNKHIQDRLRQEIVDTLNKHGKPTMDILQDMKYMDMVVSEVLRKWPPIPQTDRRLTKPYTIEPVNKSEVPVKLELGSAVWIPIYALHRAPEHYPDPDRFDPERFSPENKHKINQYTYLPFGIGPRICIGARLALIEIKSLLFQLLLNFEIVPTAKTKNPPVIVSSNFANFFKDGNWLGLKRINKA
nr:cytochrome P450 9HZ1 [Pagiophloeus tsushimanus]